jgi:superfamily II DNA or RNA helicase
MYELRQYQINGINQLATKVLNGKKRLVFQQGTGSGKTVTFAGLVNRFLTKQQKRIVILVHREELLQQTVSTIYRWYGVVAAPVTAETSYLPNVLVYVAMVETANNRLKKNPAYFGTVGLVIIDECHIGNFTKIYQYFPDSLKIGFTATPIAASKKDPLKNHYDDIAVGIDIPDLIQLWKTDNTQGLVQNKTYSIANVERKDLKVKNGEFDETEMGRVYSSSKHVQNCVAAYQKLALGEKTIIFNCNIEHSKKVNEAFLAFGYNSRHLDGETDPRERKNILRWFNDTPDAVLNNVAVLTAGFDCPSIINVIPNFSTLSLSKWLQVTGRGARPFPDKFLFRIIDLGGNALFHGDWSEARDWRDMFFNPEKPRTGGEAPVKACKGCAVLIHLSQKICPECGADNTSKARYDGERVGITSFSGKQGPYIDVKHLIDDYANKKKPDGTAYKEMAVLHEIKRQIINHAKRSWKVKRLDDQTAKQLVTIYQDRVKEWCNMKLKAYDWWLEKNSREWMYAEFKRVWNYETQILTA